MGFNLLHKEVDSVKEWINGDTMEKGGCLRHCMFVIPRNTHYGLMS